MAADRSAQPVDVLAVMETLADGYLRNEGTEHAFVTCRTSTKPGDGTAVGDAWGRLREARAAVAELVEAGNVLRQIQMHTAPWYEKGQRQAYARLVGVPETSSRRTIEQAADDRFDAALARVSGGAA